MLFIKYKQQPSSFNLALKKILSTINLYKIALEEKKTKKITRGFNNSVYESHKSFNNHFKYLTFL